MSDLTNEQLDEIKKMMIDTIVKLSDGDPEEILQSYISHIASASGEPNNVIVPTLMWMILAEAFVQDPVTMATFWKSIKNHALRRGFPIHMICTEEQVSKLLDLANATARYPRG